MRRSLLPFGLMLFVIGLGGAACGESSDSKSSSTAGQANGGDTGVSGGATAGKGGLAAGGSGSTSAGKPAGGSSGGPGGSEGGSETSGEAGAPASGLASCDPKKVLCKSLPEDCPAGEVRSVEGICWGPCLKIDQCACAAATECPEPEQYTCWAKQHCGPYVE